MWVAVATTLSVGPQRSRACTTVSHASVDKAVARECATQPRTPALLRSISAPRPMVLVSTRPSVARWPVPTGDVHPGRVSRTTEHVLRHLLAAAVTATAGSANRSTPSVERRAIRVRTMLSAVPAYAVAAPASSVRRIAFKPVTSAASRVRAARAVVSPHRGARWECAVLRHRGPPIAAMGWTALCAVRATAAVVACALLTARLV